MDPPPAVVDEANFEESNIMDVRKGTFQASSDFFDHGFTSQFGEGSDDEWEDEDDEEDEDGGAFSEGGAAPECRHQ
jgi:DnaJ family protein A protein 2